MILEAFAAIHGTIVTRLERNLCGLSAFCANRIKHFALSTTLGFAGCTAGFATYGLILEAFFCIEFLLAGCEYEFFTAILANQSLVFEHCLSFPFLVFYESICQRLTWFFPPHSPTGNLAHKPYGSPLLFLSGEPRLDLHLDRTMLTELLSAYVDRFACDWHRLSTTDPSGDTSRYYITALFVNAIFFSMFSGFSNCSRYLNANHNCHCSVPAVLPRISVLSLPGQDWLLLFF